MPRSTMNLLLAIMLFSLAALILIDLPGCVTPQPQIVQQPQIVYRTAPAAKPAVPDDPLASLPDNVRDAIVNDSRETLHDGIETIYPYSPHVHYLIPVATTRTTEIDLDPNETIDPHSVWLGDSDRFAVTFDGNSVGIKPTPIGHGTTTPAINPQAYTPPVENYRTNLRIKTDKHDYHFLLVASHSHWVEQVSFFYPEEVNAQLKARQTALHEQASK